MGADRLSSTPDSSPTPHVPKPSFRHITIRHRDRLPHWETEGGTYFVTTRLCDSLPQKLLLRLKHERDELERMAEERGTELTRAELRRLQDLQHKKVEHWLDKGIGACWLRRKEIAELVRDSFHFFDHDRYRLFSWCIMPNHYHIVFKIGMNHSLDAICHSWKSYTSHEANKLLCRNGPFWQREYHDHLVRNDDELKRCIEYVLNNPRKARLKNWPWVWVAHEYRHLMPAEYDNGD